MVMPREKKMHIGSMPTHMHTGKQSMHTVQRWDLFLLIRNSSCFCVHVCPPKMTEPSHGSAKNNTTGWLVEMPLHLHCKCGSKQKMVANASDMILSD